jgi:hypothetical protein
MPIAVLGFWAKFLGNGVLGNSPGAVHTPSRGETPVKFGSRRCNTLASGCLDRRRYDFLDPCHFETLKKGSVRPPLCEGLQSVQTTSQEASAQQTASPQAGTQTYGQEERSSQQGASRAGEFCYASVLRGCYLCPILECSTTTIDAGCRLPLMRYPQTCLPAQRLSALVGRWVI